MNENIAKLKTKLEDLKREREEKWRNRYSAFVKVGKLEDDIEELNCKIADLREEIKMTD